MDGMDESSQSSESSVSSVSSTTTPARPGGVRASDAEREQTAGRIREAASEGRLSMTELEERLAATYAARRRHELVPLEADLPGPPPACSEWSRPTPRPLDNWDRAALVVHAVLVVALAVAVLTRWVVGGMVFFWPVFPIFWALVSLAVHVRVRRYGLRPRWSRD